jgi:hypothetical protein
VGPWAGTPVDWHNQPPLGAPNVFGFYSPDHRTGSAGLIAPEQTLLEPSEFSRGFGWNWFWGEPDLKAAGCSIGGVIAAFEGSEEAFLQLMNDRYFKGYMSYPLRAKAREIFKLSEGQHLNDRGGFLMSVLLMSPEYRSMR